MADPNQPPGQPPHRFPASGDVDPPSSDRASRPLPSNLPPPGGFPHKMPPSPPIPPRTKPPLTKLAIIYGHPTGAAHKILAGTGKSGLTPVSPILPDNSLGNLHVGNMLGMTLEEKKRLEYYQNKRLNGFSSRMLEIEAFVPSYSPSNEEILGDLDGNAPIHPLLDKPQWKTPLQLPLAEFRLGHGRPGNWTVRNPMVWTALKPCLVLASRYLTNWNLFPWWDGLLSGNFASFPPHEGEFIRVFNTRNPAIAASDWERLQRRLLDCVPKIKFYFMSGRLRPLTFVPNTGLTSGFTPITRFPVKEVSVGIAFEAVEALLRADLTADFSMAERKVEVWRVANTIVHETAHAIWQVIRWEFGLVAPLSLIGAFEPYFADEPLNELGFSLEETVWGNCCFEQEHVDNGLPHYFAAPSGAVFRIPWFNVVNEGYAGTGPPRITSDRVFLSYYEHVFCPIPVGFFFDLMNPLFLDNVRVFGAEVGKLGPLTYGLKFELDVLNDSMEGNMSYRKKLYALIPVNLDNDIPLHANMMPAESRAVKLENGRRRRVFKIAAAVQNLYPPDLFLPTESEMLEKFGVPESEPEEVYDDPIPPCSRYEIIRDYILQHCTTLCLDSMWFEIPEHMLLNYIHQIEMLDPPPDRDEFRAYLHNAHQKKELFSWREECHGRVRWIDGVNAPPQPHQGGKYRLLTQEFGIYF